MQPGSGLRLAPGKHGGSWTSPWTAGFHIRPHGIWVGSITCVLTLTRHGWYDAMMAHFPDNRHAAIAATYDFSHARLIVDVGGGDGATLRHILTCFPNPSGIVFDREDVIRSIPSDSLLGGRIALASGSFFDRVPNGADIYMLTRVLHNWSDNDCLRILRVCRSVMGPNSCLLLGEQVLEPDPAKGKATDYLLDVQMMAMFGSEARTRTADEFSSLLADCGFVLRRIISTASPVSIVEAATSAS